MGAPLLPGSNAIVIYPLARGGAGEAGEADEEDGEDDIDEV